MLSKRPIRPIEKGRAPGHAEGRIRNATLTGGTGLVCDFFLKDHLGNVGMVLTEEVKTTLYPAATLEGSTTGGANSLVNHEKNFFTIDNTKIVAETSIPSWGTATGRVYHNGNPPANTSYPSGATSASSAGSVNLYKLNATANRTGLEFMIKVMPCPNSSVGGRHQHYCWGKRQGGHPREELLPEHGHGEQRQQHAADHRHHRGRAAAAPACPNRSVGGSAAAAKGVTGTQLTNWNTGVIPNTFIRGNNGETTTVPKAYINYLFFDEQFKYAGGSFSRVGTSGTVKDHWVADQAALKDIVAPKNGYIFVYVSNEMERSGIRPNHRNNKNLLGKVTSTCSYGLTP